MNKPRIKPLNQEGAPAPIKLAFERHVQEYGGRITNMKATLGHSLVAFEAYMYWYPLYAEVEEILGKRMAYLFAHAISFASDCPLCSTFFRKIIIDAGEDPDRPALTEPEADMLNFGSAIAQNKGNIPDDVYAKVAVNYTEKEMVILTGFAGIMIATNVFNNAIETGIDEYLQSYKSGQTF